MTSCPQSELSDPPYSHSDWVPLGVTQQKLPSPTWPGQLASPGGHRAVLLGAGQEEPALGSELYHSRLCRVHSAPGSASVEACSLQGGPLAGPPRVGEWDQEGTAATRAV